MGPYHEVGPGTSTGPRLSGRTRPYGATGTKANWLDQDHMQDQNYMVGPALTGGCGTRQWDLDLAEDQDHVQDQTA